MSKGNPKKAVAAILPTPVGAVKPMTLAMYAALERIESPLVTGAEPKDTAELLPSLYLLTHGAQEIFRGNLVALAFEWADTVPVAAMAEIREACQRQMKVVMDVMPEAQKKNAKGNDGWIAATVHVIAKTYGWSFREILWEVPLSALMLLRRQENLASIMPLSIIEKMDNGQ